MPITVMTKPDIILPELEEEAVYAVALLKAHDGYSIRLYKLKTDVELPEWRRVTTLKDSKRGPRSMAASLAIGSKYTKKIAEAINAWCFRRALNKKTLSATMEKYFNGELRLDG